MSVFSVSSRRAALSFAGLLCLSVSLLLPSTAHAQFITTSPDPFQGSQLTLQAPTPQLYTPLGYAQTFALTNIAETSNNIVGGDDVIDYTALLNGTFYTTPALTTPTASISLPGSFEVTLTGRTSPFATGTFPYIINSIAFSGVINGHTLSVELNPAQISQGMTTITPGPGLGEFTITAPAVLFGQRSIDGGPPITGPTFDVNVGPAPAAVPEPGLYPMAALLSAGGLLTWRRTKRRN